MKYMFSFSRSYWCPHFYLHEIWANVCIWIKSVESLSPLKALHTFVTNISMLKHEWTTHKINHLTLSLDSTFLNLCGLERVAWMLSSVTFQIFANWSQYLVLCTILSLNMAKKLFISSNLRKTEPGIFCNLQIRAVYIYFPLAILVDLTISFVSVSVNDQIVLWGDNLKKKEINCFPNHHMSMFAQSNQKY